MKKKLIIAALVLLSTAAVFASGSKEEVNNNVIKIGATPEPHSVMLNLVKDELEAQGYDLQIIEFTDYVTPNEALASGEIDANFFQHLPYLESYNSEHNGNLVSAGGIHIEPIVLYSNKAKTLNDIPEGGVIAVPNDPTNEGRSLLLLQSAGLITLKDGAGLEATPFDIKDNPKNLKFEEIEAASLPRVLADVDAAVINGNYAIPAGLIASRDGLFIEGSDSPYVNVVAVLEGVENEPKIKALVKALHGQVITDYVAEKYPNNEVVLVN
jgi:D-methionine transport system substrate-binding protein